MSEQNKQMIRKVSECFTNGDVEGFLSYCHPDIQWTMHGYGPMKGKAAVGDGMRHPDYPTPPELTIEKMIADEEHVVVTGIVRMKKITGEINTSAYCDIYQVTEGLILEMESYVVDLK